MLITQTGHTGIEPAVPGSKPGALNHFANALMHLEGFEPPTVRSVAVCAIQLRHRCIMFPTGLEPAYQDLEDPCLSIRLREHINAVYRTRTCKPLNVIDGLAIRCVTDYANTAKASLEGIEPS